MAGNSAMGLWIRAGSWSSAQLTDGFVPSHMALAMANAMANPCDADALVSAGLWDEEEGGYRFHDWSDFQPSAADEREKRKARSLAGKKGAESRWGGKSDGKPDSKPMANAMANGCDVDAPTRPDPSPVGSRRKPERPLPDDWAATDTHKAYAKAEGINLDFQAERFRAWAKSKDVRYRDWDAAFKNWLLKADRNKTPVLTGWDQKGVHQ